MGVKREDAGVEGWVVREDTGRLGRMWIVVEEDAIRGRSAVPSDPWNADPLVFLTGARSRRDCCFVL